MKTFITSILALLGVAEAHYNFIRLQGNGIQASDWQYMRKVGNPPGGGSQYDPMYPADLITDNIRCNRAGAKPAPGIKSLPVNAGQTIRFKLDSGLFHQSLLMGCMAKVPAGSKAESWDGSGKVWFKTYQDNITEIITTQGSGFTYTEVKWENYGKYDVTYNIPTSLPNGEYLFRAEHFGLHFSTSPPENGGGVQSFVSCAHLLVSRGGTSTPRPLVEFPGAYTPGEPGLFFDVYNNSLTWNDAMKYQPPGPLVWVV